MPFAIIYNGGHKHNFRKSLIDRDEACLFVANSTNKFKGFDLYKDFAKKSLLIEELKDLQFYSAGNVDSLKEAINAYDGEVVVDFVIVMVQELEKTSLALAPSLPSLVSNSIPAIIPKFLISLT